METDMKRTERRPKDRTPPPLNNADQPDQAGAHDFGTALHIFFA